MESKRIRCVVPRGVNNAPCDYKERDGYANYLCQYDPSGCFTGGFFTITDIQMSRDNWEIGTLFKNINTGNRIKITKTSRPRPDKPSKVMQYIGKEKG